MKTKKQFRVPARLRLLMVLLVVATAIVVISSCGKNKNSDALAELLPPPPPPPPPVTPGTDEVFTKVDSLPVFKDGDPGIVKFIKDNIKYPRDAKVKNIQGKVFVKFIVEKDGSVSNVEILKGSNPLLDAEALRVVGSLPKFEKPAKQAGEKVRVNYVIPITFTLQ